MTHDIHAHPEPIVAIGRLPTPWPLGSVFVGNLDCIFFGDQGKTSQLIANVTGFHGYGSRLLPILGLLFRGDNLLLLQEAPDATLAGYFSRTLKLPLPDIALIDIPPGCATAPDPSPQMMDRIRHHRATLMDGYVTDPYLEQLAADCGKTLVNSHQACRDANDKVLLFRFLTDTGMPIFDGGETDLTGGTAQRFAALKKMGYQRAVVRAPIGASGFGMSIVDLAGDRTIPTDLCAGGTVLIQGWIEERRMGVTDLSSPSVQFFAGPAGQITLYELTDQLLSRHSVHEGNMAPPAGPAADPAIREELIRQAKIVAGWVAEVGFNGPGSIDFLVGHRHGIPFVNVCEVNARVTGATYPSLLALSLNPGGGWLMRNMVFGPCLTVGQFLDHLEHQGLLFLPGKNHGILPINLARTANGQISKCQLLFLAPDGSLCQQMVADFPSHLPTHCRFDRD